MEDPIKWFAMEKEGLYFLPGKFYIDPFYPVSTAVISHAHADHAVSGHQFVIAHPDTISLMQIRNEEYSFKFKSLNYFETINHNDVILYLLPAGHILGSAQVVIEYKGTRIIFSGDYKRTPDPTCEQFFVEPCDVFITEATFGLPIFKHPAIHMELKRLLDSLTLFPTRCHLVGVYALGKCQRIIKELRNLGYLEPIYIHSALKKICDFYEARECSLGIIQMANTLDKYSAQGKIILCPPSSLHDRWSRRFGDVVVALASGWMQIRARAKQKKIELPLVISDHADWNELINTIQEINPSEIWITHGQEEALLHYTKEQGYQARPLHFLENQDSED
ncbi:ligase-associated DNA damage response exonuclease [Legionella sp. WA2024007413]